MSALPALRGLLITVQVSHGILVSELIQWATTVLGLQATAGSWWADVDSPIGRAWSRRSLQGTLVSKEALEYATPGALCRGGIIRVSGYVWGEQGRGVRGPGTFLGPHCGIMAPWPPRGGSSPCLRCILLLHLILTGQSNIVAVPMTSLNVCLIGLGGQGKPASEGELLPASPP